MRIDHVFKEFISKGEEFDDKITPTNFECLKKLMNTYKRHCGSKMEEYDLQYVRYMVFECERLPVPSAVDALIHRLEKACKL